MTKASEFDRPARPAHPAAHWDMLSSIQESLAGSRIAALCLNGNSYD